MSGTVPSQKPHVRFDRLLSNRGYCSRKEARVFLKIHSCFEGDTEIIDPSRHVNPEIVTIDGEALDPPPGILLMLHKPPSVVCSHREHGRLIYEFLPERFSRRDPPLSSVGRLDKDATGLLLLTDDGHLNHQLTSPKRHVPKQYEVTVADPFSGEEAALFASGTLMLESETTPLLPAIFVPHSSHTGTLTLHEGRYHQIKRMFGALGNKVTKLHRISIGNLLLGALDEGAWRWVTPEEREALATFSSSPQ